MYGIRKPVLTLLVAGLLSTAASGAFAQAVKENWNFTPQSRASIAALIRQVENEKRSNANAMALAAAGSQTVLTCGKGESSAEANSTCIIMNNSDGLLNVDQDSAGDQSSHNSPETTLVTASGADDVLDALNGNN